MPRRLRVPKALAQLDVQTELRVWRMKFETAYDFHSDLARLGIDARYPESSLEITREAWARLGPSFLDHVFQPGRFSNRSVPWALQRFGDPRLPLAKRREELDPTPVYIGSDPG